LHVLNQRLHRFAGEWLFLENNLIVLAKSRPNNRPLDLNGGQNIHKVARPHLIGHTAQVIHQHRHRLRPWLIRLSCGDQDRQARLSDIGSSDPLVEVDLAHRLLVQQIVRAFKKLAWCSFEFTLGNIDHSQECFRVGQDRIRRNIDPRDDNLLFDLYSGCWHQIW
jgi:hypothetical protein